MRTCVTITLSIHLKQDKICKHRYFCSLPSHYFILLPFANEGKCKQKTEFVDLAIKEVEFQHITSAVGIKHPGEGHVKMQPPQLAGNDRKSDRRSKKKIARITFLFKFLTQQIYTLKWKTNNITISLELHLIFR